MSIEPKKLREMINDYHIGDKVVFLDVRDDDELEDGVLHPFSPQGVPLPLHRIPVLDVIEWQIGELEKYKEDHQIFVYWRSGMKSATATRVLQYNGFNTMNIWGGMKKIREEIPVDEIGKILDSLTFLEYFEITTFLKQP